MVGPEHTEIVGGGGDPTAIKAWVDELKDAASHAVNHEQWILAERIARLAGATVTVRVGGATTDEIREKLYRAQSARSAFAVAVASGCVPGGGAAFLAPSGSLEQLETRDTVRHEAIAVVRRALESPLRILLAPGVDLGDTIDQVRTAGPLFGYNAKSGKVEDLVAAGIVDPVATLTRALEIAHAAARSFFETGAWHVHTDR